MVVLLAHFGAPRPRRQIATCSDANRCSKWSFLWPTSGRLRPVATAAIVRTLIIVANGRFYGPLRGTSAPSPTRHFVGALIIVANGRFVGPLWSAPARRQIATCSDANRRSKWSFCWPTLGHLGSVAKSPLVRALIVVANGRCYGPLWGASAPSPQLHLFGR